MKIRNGVLVLVYCLAFGLSACSQESIPVTLEENSITEVASVQETDNVQLGQEEVLNNEDWTPVIQVLLRRGDGSSSGWLFLDGQHRGANRGKLFDL